MEYTMTKFKLGSSAVAALLVSSAPLLAQDTTVRIDQNLEQTLNQNCSGTAMGTDGHTYAMTTTSSGDCVAVQIGVNNVGIRGSFNGPSAGDRDDDMGNGGGQNGGGMGNGGHQGNNGNNGGGMGNGDHGDMNNDHDDDMNNDHDDMNGNNNGKGHGRDRDNRGGQNPNNGFGNGGNDGSPNGKFEDQSEIR
jgi:hypothetical protein